MRVLLSGWRCVGEERLEPRVRGVSSGRRSTLLVCLAALSLTQLRAKYPQNFLQSSSFLEELRLKKVYPPSYAEGKDPTLFL